LIVSAEAVELVVILALIILLNLIYTFSFLRSYERAMTRAVSRENSYLRQIRNLENRLSANSIQGYLALEGHDMQQKAMEQAPQPPPPQNSGFQHPEGVMAPRTDDVEADIQRSMRGLQDG
jgi:hypothetical protein